MSLSTQRAVSDGSMTSLALSLSYLERSEITVYFNGINSPLASGLWAWVGTTSNTLSFSPAVPNSVEVLIKRVTDISDVRNAYNLGAQFNQATLDENFMQTLHAVQETSEGGTLSEVFNDLDMHGFHVSNLAPAVASGDAVSKTYLESYVSSLPVVYATNTVTTQSFSGTGAQTVFTLTSAPAFATLIDVHINGVYQHKSTYNIVGTALTFSEAPISGTANIEVQASASQSIGSTDANLVRFAPTGVTNSTNVQDAIVEISTDLASPNGASLVGYMPAGVGAVAGTVDVELRRSVWVDQFGFNNIPGSTDMTAAINAAIVAAGPGGEVKFLGAAYKVTEVINAENLRGLTMSGMAGQYGWAGTRIIGAHTGKAVLSLVGSLFCDLKNINIEGTTAARPKTGLLLGRASAASAGNHTFTNVHVQGYYSVIGLYNIASEENTFVNCYIVPNASPIAGAYFGQGDAYAIGGLTGSSMESNTFIGGTIGSGDGTAGSTGLFLDCGAGSGHHNFFNTFMTKNGGDSFIKIQLGSSDGLDTQFPISFYNVVGEYNTNPPANGLHFVSASSRILSGFTAKNLRFDAVNTNNILCDGGGTVYLIGPEISTPYKSTGNKPSTLQRVDGGRLSLLSESSVTIGTLAATDLLTNSPVALSVDLGGNTRRLMSGTGYTVPALTLGLVQARVSPVYGATVAIDAYLGNTFDINVSTASAFTISNPINPASGQRVSIRIRNNAGVMGLITWGTNYKLAAWVNPAVSNSKSIDFVYDGYNWIETSRTQSDVPN